MTWKLLVMGVLLGLVVLLGVARQAVGGGQEAPAAASSGVRLTVVYDNVACRPGLETDWGFACVVQAGGKNLLFDTGAKGEILLANLRGLDFDPESIEAVVLSHEHGDHTGGLASLLKAGATPRIFMPASFPQELKQLTSSSATLVEVAGPTEVAPGIHATGPLPRGFVEQALVVSTARGLVVITGCAHPGVVKLVARAREVAGEAKLEPANFHLVMGGFHLRDANALRVRQAISELRDLLVERIAPSHCTGEEAIEMFAGDFGSGFLRSGLGYSVMIR